MDFKSIFILSSQNLKDQQQQQWWTKNKIKQFKTNCSKENYNHYKAKTPPKNKHYLINKLVKMIQNQTLTKKSYQGWLHLVYATKKSLHQRTILSNSCKIQFWQIVATTINELRFWIINYLRAFIKPCLYI